MNGIRKTGAFFMIIGSIFVLIAIYILVYHYVLGNNMYYGRGGGLVPSSAVLENIFVVCGIGSLFMLMGILCLRIRF